VAGSSASCLPACPLPISAITTFYYALRGRRFAFAARGEASAIAAVRSWEPVPVPFPRAPIPRRTITRSESPDTPPSTRAPGHGNASGSGAVGGLGRFRQQAPGKTTVVSKICSTGFPLHNQQHHQLSPAPRPKFAIGSRRSVPLRLSLPA